LAVAAFVTTACVMTAVVTAAEVAIAVVVTAAVDVADKGCSKTSHCVRTCTMFTLAGLAQHSCRDTKSTRVLASQDKHLWKRRAALQLHQTRYQRLRSCEKPQHNDCSGDFIRTLCSFSGHSIKQL